MMKFNAYSYLQKKTNILLFVNILLTAIFVNYWGLKGAVISILITEVLAATLLNYWFKGGIIADSQRKSLFISTYRNK